MARFTPAAAIASWSDDELVAWLLAHPGPVWHPMATYRIGSKGRLEPDGQVRGCKGLYVADASALPHAPAANPQLPVMALAWRIADGLAQD